MCQNRSFSYRRFSQKFYQKTTFLIFWKKRMILSEKKNKVLKRAQKWTFSKGVSPWILSKNRTFSFPCFSRKLCHKKSFLNILNKKQSFLDQKMILLTRAKKWTFSKGVSPWILSKNRNFSYGCFLQKLCQKKSFFNFLDRKKNIVRPKN